MFNRLFCTALCSICLLSSTANASKAPYADYVNCYYELNQNYERDENVDAKKFVGGKTVPFYKEDLGTKPAYKDLINNNSYDMYLFSIMGVYGVNYTAVTYGGNTCALDIQVKADDNSYYFLCDNVTWNTETSKYESELNNDFCINNDLISKNYQKPEKANAKKLDPSYFNSLLKELKSDYGKLAYQYILSPFGFNGFMCADSVSKKRGESIFRGAEDGSASTPADKEDRRTSFNDIVMAKDCYSACKKLNVVKPIEKKYILGK